MCHFTWNRFPIKKCRQILLRLNPLGQRKLPIVISLSRMLCFGRVCASPCALNVNAALQGAYITPFPMEVVRAIRAQRDEAYVSKIVCYLHVMASNPHPPPWRAPHLHHFYFTSPQPIRPKEASDSDFTIEGAGCLHRFLLIPIVEST